MQSEAGSPTPFRQFLVTASATPLPTGAVVFETSKGRTATGEAVLGCPAQ